MKYKTITIAAAALFVGYAIRSLFVPSTPEELSSALEREIMKDPVKYEQVIDQTMEVSHRMKAQANSYPTEQGYVPFQDLQLAIEYADGNNLTMLVNTDTQELLPVRYVNGKTAVGSYKERLDSIVAESHGKVAEIAEKIIPDDGFGKKLRDAKGYVITKTKAAGQYTADKAERAWLWLKYDVLKRELKKGMEEDLKEEINSCPYDPNTQPVTEQKKAGLVTKVGNYLLKLDQWAEGKSPEPVRKVNDEIRERFGFTEKDRQEAFNQLEKNAAKK